MKRRSRPAYSGARSRPFWARVKALPASHRHQLYSCGVLLQQLEAQVLNWLDDAEVVAARRKR